MRGMPKLLYWVSGLVGVGAWSSLIIAIAHLPLPVELALGGMGFVVLVWGHAVLFPTPRAVAPPAAPGRHSREAALDATSRMPVGGPRQVVSRPPRNPGGQPIPAGPLPALLRTPLEEAARMEARRLGEALTAAGLFGPVSVRIEEDGTAFVAPVRETEGVRLPATTVVRFAAYVTQPSGLAEDGRAGAGAWPGRDLAAAIEAHLNANLPAGRPAGAPRPAPRAAMPNAGWTALPVGARPHGA
ncbi:hypothetical protein [Falsiroseomonas sp. CW058]|uniref:hypothetical protein n=1 Tax=Falsiroseomonas sp. CW058 TaxID=3388664 RepID=UPI003D319902